MTKPSNAAMLERVEKAMLKQGLTPMRHYDIPGIWVLAQYPNGIWIAVCPGSMWGPQWWNGKGCWRDEPGNAEETLNAIKRGPPDLDSLRLQGHWENWVTIKDGLPVPKKKGIFQGVAGFLDYFRGI